MNADQSPGDPRVRFAAERTLLAWMRTGLAMMGFGFVVARFGVFLREVQTVEQENETRTPGISLWIGSGLIFLGVLVTVFAAIQHAGFLHRLRQGKPLVFATWSMGIMVSFVLAALGITMLGYLIFVST